jgi:hypothetical protein
MIWDAVIFFVMKIFHFSIESNMVKGTFWKFSQKIITFKEGNYEVAKIWRGFGEISSPDLLLLLESPYLANKFKGSPTCNKTPRFFYSSILVVARFG